MYESGVGGEIALNRAMGKKAEFRIQKRGGGFGAGTDFG
jgi:hypothetical protein